MLRLKKVTRVATTALLIVLVSLPIAALKVPSVSAHDNEHVHPYISEEAAKLLPEWSNMRAEIDTYMGRVTRPWYDSEGIKDGAYEEDCVDLVYSDLTYDLDGIRTIPHFWDADKNPPEDRVKNMIGEDDMFPNAYEKACELFQMALKDYQIGQTSPAHDYYKWIAYTDLGHVTHLLGDMGVPAHAHEDFHLDIVGIDDDCFEKWMPSGAYMDYGAGSALAQGGLITFPDEVKAKVRNGDWRAGLYYLMYTTNQYADYFASDDADGDSYDKEGWMDYSGWPSSPTRQSDLEDNDWFWVGPVPVDDNNNDDGDLGRIAHYAFVYSIRAVATLYKMFYELTHPPTGTITIRFADHDADGKADYKWVSLDLTYDVGADEYVWDLECRFRNKGDPTWTSWEAVRRRRSWILSEGNGPKTVYYQLRNLMGNQSIEYSASVELLQTAIPQIFNYEFSATGAQSLTAQVDFYIHKIWLRQEAGDGQVEFYFKHVWVDDGHGNALTADERVPWKDFHFKIDQQEHAEKGFDLSSVNYFDGDIDYHALGGVVWTDTDYDFSLVHSINVLPGQTVRLRTHAYDNDDPWEDTDDNLGSVWTDTFTVPNEVGTHVLEGDYGVNYGWWHWEADTYSSPNPKMNEYYSIQVTIVATVSYVPWSLSEGPYRAAVGYGKAPGINSDNYIADSSLTAPADTVPPYPSTTKWDVNIDNPAIQHAMNGRSLYAWTTKPEPDMLMAVLSPVDFVITDPNGNTISSHKYRANIIGMPWVWELTSNVPGSSILRRDLDGDGIEDTLIVFDERKVGDYQVQVSPSIDTDPAETYSIGVLSSALPHKAGFLSQDVQLAEIPTQPLVMKSTATKLNLPPNADANGPYSATEGTAIEFDASGSTDPEGDSLTYRWDFENDGTWDTAWSSNPTASHTWYDDWTGIVKVEVSDGTKTATSTATVTVSNVAPTVNAGPDQLASPGQEVHFSGSFTDPGADTHTIIWDFNDSTTATGTLTPTHVYSQAKKYTVNLTVTDDDGGVGRDTLTFNTGVEVSIDPVRAVVPPGDDTTYHVKIHHLGKTEDTYNLNLYGLDSTWYSLSTASIKLDPDQTGSVTLEVSPPNTAPIATYGFTVVASSQVDPTIADKADAEAMVATSHDLALEEIPPVTHLEIGEPKYIDLINSKIYVTSVTPFTLTAEDNPGGTGVASTYYHICNTTYDTGRLKYTAPFYLTGLSDGQYSIVYYSKDNAANREEVKSEPLILDNTPPTIAMVIDPVRINTPVTLTATVDDSKTGGCRIASAEFSVDGGTWMPMNALDGSFDEATEEVTVTLDPISTPDVFAISVRAADALGNQNQLLTLLAVYDPAAGFVTGAGWINSPLGAYSADPSLTGKATFGFVSRYQKGANTPTGQTEFQFHAGNLDFHSTDYQWLVIAGPRAQFKGSGTIKGSAGECGFMLTAIDGQINGGGGVDKFRIKIWDKATGVILYDNQMDIADIGNPTTAIVGGSIVIHT